MDSEGSPISRNVFAARKVSVGRSTIAYARGFTTTHEQLCIVRLSSFPLYGSIRPFGSKLGRVVAGDLSQRPKEGKQRGFEVRNGVLELSGDKDKFYAHLQTDP